MSDFMHDVAGVPAEHHPDEHWKIGVLAEPTAGDEFLVARVYLTALCNAYQVDARVVPFERLDDLARDLAEGCLDAVFAVRASEVPVVEGCTAATLTFANARVWFFGRTRTPTLAVARRGVARAGDVPKLERGAACAPATAATPTGAERDPAGNTKGRAQASDFLTPSRSSTGGRGREE